MQNLDVNHFKTACFIFVQSVIYCQHVQSQESLYKGSQRFIQSSYFTFYDNLLDPNTNISKATNSTSRKVNEIKVEITKAEADLYSSLPELDKALSECGENKIDIRELTIPQVQEYFKSKSLLSVGLTICYLKRIERMNSALNAVIEVNPDAIKNALKVDLEKAMGIDKGLLHGIPILLKDNIATGDQMETTAGSLALKGIKPLRDSRVVKRLRTAGAVILGKANLSEFANFRGTDVPDGWSGRGGQTMCPYNSSADPNGSSSGPAVAIAANLAMAALGTETDGSIASPASRQSIVGLKTTVGLVSTQGIIPLAPSQDVIGPMTRTVSDAAIILHEIVEKGLKLGKCGLGIQQCLENKEFRVGVVRDPYWNISSQVLQLQLPQLNATLEILEEMKEVDLVDPVQPKVDLFDKVSPDSEFTTFLHEFKHGINEYLKTMVHVDEFNNTIKSLEGIIRFNERHPSPEGYNQQILQMAHNTDGINNAKFRDIRDANIKAAKAFLDFLFQNYDLDALLGPSEGDLNSPMIFSMAAIAGYPSLTIPVGFTETGVPFGITLVGKAFGEKEILKIGSLLESAYPARRPPQFLSAPSN